MKKFKQYAPFIIGVFLIVGLAFVAQKLISNDNNENSGNEEIVLNAMPIAEDVTNDAIKKGLDAKQRQFENSQPEYPDSEKIIYEINDGKADQTVIHPADAQLWDVIKALSPTEKVLNSISQFEVYFDEEDDTLASVETISDTNHQWLFSINYIAVTDFNELAPTIIHEFAHILSLQDTQTITDAEQDNISESCPRYKVDEGCLEEGSYLDGFFARFWKDSGLYQESDRNDDEAIGLYEERPSEFVSEYATTNPVEDFAESVRVYVTSEPVEGEDIKTQKTNYAGNYDELVTYRLLSREQMANWAS